MSETSEEHAAKARVAAVIQAELHNFAGWDENDILLEWTVVVGTSDPRYDSKIHVGGITGSHMSSHHVIGLLHTSLELGWTDTEPEES